MRNGYHQSVSLLTTVACLLLLLSCQKPEEAAPAPTSTIPYVPPVYSFSEQPVWQDEFATDGLPGSTKWGYDLGGSGWGNREQQYYTKELTNARVENGKLVIEARKETNGSYTSARLVTKTKGDWKYGKVVVRAKLPQGRGTWPAIWMLPTNQVYGTQYWPDNGEIDIMEHVGFDPNVIHASTHSKLLNFTLNTQKTAVVTVPAAMSEFHNYTLEWTPELMKISVDENTYFTFQIPGNDWRSWPFDQPFHLLLNIAVGGDWGGQKGIDDTIFPQRLEVDYVRVYSLVQK